jgi:hypothetical protein
VHTSLEVADIFQAAGPAYRAAHAGHLSLQHLKVMSAIEHCRTAALGGHVEACEDCGHWRIAYNSCRAVPVDTGRVFPRHGGEGEGRRAASGSHDLGDAPNRPERMKRPDFSGNGTKPERCDPYL